MNKIKTKRKIGEQGSNLRHKSQKIRHKSQKITHEQSILTMDDYKSKYEHITAQLNYINNKQKLVMNIINLLKRIIPDMNYAIRNYFFLESLFELETLYENINFEDNYIIPEIFIVNNTDESFDNSQKYEEINTKLLYFINEQLEIIHIHDMIGTYPKIGNYTLLNIKNVSELDTSNIHYNLTYRLFFLDEQNRTITIDITSHLSNVKLIHYATHTNIMNLITTTNGTNTLNNINFFDIMFSMQHKQIEALIDLEKLQIIALDTTSTCENLHNFVTLLNFIKNKTEFILGGYNIVGENKSGFPDIYLEKTEDCHISSCSPPYISVRLICEHKLSLMSLMAMVVYAIKESDSNQDARESLKCPFHCGDLRILFNYNNIKECFTIQRRNAIPIIMKRSLTKTKPIFSESALDFFKELDKKEEKNNKSPKNKNTKRVSQYSERDNRSEETEDVEESTDDNNDSD